MYKEPKSIDEIIIPEVFKTVEGELFVVCDKMYVPGERIIILTTVSSVEILSQSEMWLMDGTFDVVPTIMRQLFSVHGTINSNIVPLVFCLMSKKSEEAYCEFFFELCKFACHNNINLNPKFVMVDFEKASTKAMNKFFPNAVAKGCNFHFSQILWRRIQTESLQVKYGRYLF